MRVLILALLLVLASCNSENAEDCFQTSGKTVEIDYQLENFTKLRAETDVIVHIKQGPEYKVTLRTGKNLVNEALIEVQGDVLVLRNDNRCNLVRKYGNFEVFVTVPNLTEIRHNSAREIYSDGTLVFPNLYLVSNTSINLDVILRKTGEFHLDLDTENLRIDANGKSVFYITGEAENMKLSFQNENPRFEGRDFVVQNIEVYHRAPNKMIVNPQQSLIGVITGTGDVIAVNRPPVVDVEERYTGRLIFED